MNNNQVRQVAVNLAHSGRFRKILTALALAVVFLGLLMPVVERGAVNARIKTEWDGLYFSAMIVTGSGYGDMAPVTPVGKAMTILLEFFGVVLFGSIMAFVSVELLRYQEDFNMRRILERMDEQDSKIEGLKKHLDFLVKK